MMRVSEQTLGGSTSVGTTLYYNNIKNLINDNATFTSLTNVGKAITEGVEASLRRNSRTICRCAPTTPIPTPMTGS